ncbi:hypothetical protein A1O7_01351 [Cladophialophora yegresii CBS 114405]|uniref:Uncharacterized protein n=1 Tax=Cladophialophora yegresii CBS 114405 TaxID=1182544 RepID=W9WA62_9EURO|nr:uncharacterized protein A1O7_01351 [Cladophialophora yegresii CBS 114405]EXJ65012.1 hypothetical protein A1O7_01351 [Cladophialophora yegresii CBS 114405]
MSKATTASRNASPRLSHHPSIQPAASTDTRHDNTAPAPEPRRTFEGRLLGPEFRILEYLRSDNHGDVYSVTRTPARTRQTTQARATDRESTLLASSNSYEAKAVDLALCGRELRTHRQKHIKRLKATASYVCVLNAWGLKWVVRRVKCSNAVVIVKDAGTVTGTGTGKDAIKGAVTGSGDGTGTGMGSSSSSSVGTTSGAGPIGDYTPRASSLFPFLDGDDPPQQSECVALRSPSPLHHGGAETEQVQVEEGGGHDQDEDGHGDAINTNIADGPSVVVAGEAAGHAAPSAGAEACESESTRSENSSPARDGSTRPQKQKARWRAKQRETRRLIRTRRLESAAESNAVLLPLPRRRVRIALRLPGSGGELWVDSWYWFTAGQGTTTSSDARPENPLSKVLDGLNCRGESAQVYLLMRRSVYAPRPWHHTRLLVGGGPSDFWKHGHDTTFITVDRDGQWSVPAYRWACDGERCSICHIDDTNYGQKYP